MTEEDQAEMLKKIEVKDVGELFEQIPEQLRLKQPLNLPAPLSEMELMAMMEKLAKEGEIAASKTSFLGGGINRHYVPATISSLISREEFLTAYTPYQPEASQGTLQALYEFQTYIAMLSGMDAANASLYDGATATAEAVLMAKRINKKGNTVYVSSALHPHYREVLRTYLRDVDIPIVELAFDPKTGKTIILPMMNDALAVVVGYPNYFGVIEDLKDAREVATKIGALLISVTTEALALALLKPPGEFGVDIFVGEGQSFGLPPSFGGPLLGLIATKEAYVRNLPGRIIGRGQDKNGKDAFVIVIATREQHIKREKATSNICTNEALCATIAGMYLTAYGKTGLAKLAQQNAVKAFRLRKKLAKIPGVSIPFSGNTFNEFVIRTEKRYGHNVLHYLTERDIFGGIALSKHYSNNPNDILVSVTEMNTDEDAEKLVHALTEIMK
ncbi:MAG: aminomethyl-transferring glycine dehydrogenase subunit GcvPA [Candidatus Pacebacteria bacterium]|jgi:glycine dehydrogenase subunit 1|nr:aminomethyl-transferring glycine dehydrogenase subunit GcvPA [Candidatus Paceibacterota bacterium]